MTLFVQALLANSYETGELVCIAASQDADSVKASADYFREFFTRVASSPDLSNEDGSKMIGVIRSMHIVDAIVTPVESV